MEIRDQDRIDEAKIEDYVSCSCKKHIAKIVTKSYDADIDKKKLDHLEQSSDYRED
jgi:hypothetical protein